MYTHTVNTTIILKDFGCTVIYTLSNVFIGMFRLYEYINKKQTKTLFFFTLDLQVAP